MSIIYDIALVIVIAALLVFIIGWAYDWGLKANQNYKIELEHMVGKEQFTNAVLEEGLKMNSEVIESLVERKNELERLHMEQARALREINNEVISLHTENQKLKDQGSRDKIRIRELECACDKRNEYIESIKLECTRQGEYIKNLQEQILDYKICVRALKKQILHERLSVEEDHALKKEG